MIEIKPLERVDSADLQRCLKGYTSPARYSVSRQESEGQVTLLIQRVQLAAPYVKRFDLPQGEELARYQGLPRQGFCFGAYEAGSCVGLALAEPTQWNKSLWVWELGVAETHHRQGIGRRLLEALEKKARDAGLRILVCETQNTNGAAIDFYRVLGFQIEGIDLSYYSNSDYPDGEIAVFMKKRLE